MEGLPVQRFVVISSSINASLIHSRQYFIQVDASYSPPSSLTNFCQASTKSRGVPRPTLPRVPRSIMEVAFPDSAIPDENLSSDILNYLPPRAEAYHLCEVYMEYGKFLLVILSPSSAVYIPLSPHSVITPFQEVNLSTRSWLLFIDTSTYLQYFPWRTS